MSSRIPRKVQVGPDRHTRPQPSSHRLRSTLISDFLTHDELWLNLQDMVMPLANDRAEKLKLEREQEQRQQTPQHEINLHVTSPNGSTSALDTSLASPNRVIITPPRLTQAKFSRQINKAADRLCSFVDCCGGVENPRMAELFKAAVSDVFADLDGEVAIALAEAIRALNLEKIHLHDENDNHDSDDDGGVDLPREEPEQPAPRSPSPPHWGTGGDNDSPDYSPPESFETMEDVEVGREAEVPDCKSTSSSKMEVEAETKTQGQASDSTPGPGDATAETKTDDSVNEPADLASPSSSHSPRGGSSPPRTPSPSDYDLEPSLLADWVDDRVLGWWRSGLSIAEIADNLAEYLPWLAPRSAVDWNRKDYEDGVYHVLHVHRRRGGGQLMHRDVDRLRMMWE